MAEMRTTGIGNQIQALILKMPLDWAHYDGMCGVTPTSLVLAATVVAVAYYFQKNRGLPPGPTGVPFLGFWPFIDRNQTYVQFDEMKKKYGDVFSFSVCGTLYINLCSSKALREAHISKSDSFSNRIEHFSLLTELFKGGTISLNNEDWKANRKFFHQIIKERVSLSVKNMLSGSLYDTINSTIVELREKKGEAVKIVDFLTDKANANMRLMLFGENGISEERVTEISEMYSVLNACLTTSNILLTGNVAKYLILPFSPLYNEGMKNLRKIQKIVSQVIDEHKSTYDENHPRDIIDDYIKERVDMHNNGDPTAQYFTDEALMSSVVQLLSDGVQSVAIFMSLFIKTLLDHPEEQEKIYRELVEVVGQDRQPTLDDKSKLTYTNAFLLEAMRTTDLSPILPSLECIKETTLFGYRIPKGSVSVMNFYSIHNDSNTYEEPHKFDASRFILTDDGRKPEPIFLFGIGKRACIAESFTMVQTFLFITTLVKNFRISVPRGLERNTFQLLNEARLKIMLEPRE